MLVVILYNNRDRRDTSVFRWPYGDEVSKKFLKVSPVSCSLFRGRCLCDIYLQCNLCSNILDLVHPYISKLHPPTTGPPRNTYGYSKHVNIDLQLESILVTISSAISKEWSQFNSIFDKISPIPSL